MLARAAVVEQLVHRGAHGAPGVEHVVDQHRSRPSTSNGISVRLGSCLRPSCRSRRGRTRRRSSRAASAGRAARAGARRATRRRYRCRPWPRPAPHGPRMLVGEPRQQSLRRQAAASHRSSSRISCAATESTASAPAPCGLAQALLGLERGQALVDQLDRQMEAAAQLAREALARAASARAGAVGVRAGVRPPAAPAAIRRPAPPIAAKRASPRDARCAAADARCASGLAHGDTDAPVPKSKARTVSRSPSSGMSRLVRRGARSRCRAAPSRRRAAPRRADRR